jgi:hypothetical protein
MDVELKWEGLAWAGEIVYKGNGKKVDADMDPKKQPRK